MSLISLSKLEEVAHKGSSRVSQKFVTALYLVLLTVIVASTYGRTFLPWAYLLSAIFIGMLAFILILKGWIRSSIFLLVAMGIVLWNIYNLYMNFSMIPLFDSYSEYIFAGTVLEKGHFQLNMNWPLLYPSPTDPSSYPLFSILSATVASVTGIDLVHTAMVMTTVNGLAALLFTVLFVKFLSNDNPAKNIILVVAVLFFVTSPDAIYNAMDFYHRHFSLALGFAMLYLLARRFCADTRDAKSVALLVFFASILPLSYSYYPAVYILFLFWLAMFSYFAGFSKGVRKGIRMNVPLFVFLIMFACGFLWYLDITFPNTFTKAMQYYISQLSNPTLSSFELARSSNTTAVLPQSLTLAPLDRLLQVRDLLTFLPMAIYTILLTYRFVVNRQRDTKEIFLLLGTVSFAPLAIMNFFAGGWGSLEWRYYMMPIIVYFAAVFYTRLLQRKGKSKQLISILVVFLVVLSFTSIFSHLYFPRYIYDPSISSNEVGQPSPAYITLRGVITSHLPESEHLISDDVYLLHILLPYGRYGQIVDQRYFGKPNTVFIELTNLRNPRDGAIIFNQTKLMSDYYKVLDGKPYTVYYSASG